MLDYAFSSQLHFLWCCQRKDMLSNTKYHLKLLNYKTLTDSVRISVLLIFQKLTSAFVFSRRKRKPKRFWSAVINPQVYPERVCADLSPFHNLIMRKTKCSEKIKVICRVRPFLEHEVPDDSISVSDNRIELENQRNPDTRLSYRYVLIVAEKRPTDQLMATLSFKASRPATLWTLLNLKFLKKMYDH